MIQREPKHQNMIIKYTIKHNTFSSFCSIWSWILEIRKMLKSSKQKHVLLWWMRNWFHWYVFLNTNRLSFTAITILKATYQQSKRPQFTFLMYLLLFTCLKKVLLRMMLELLPHLNIWIWKTLCLGYCFEEMRKWVFENPHAKPSRTWGSAKLSVMKTCKNRLQSKGLLTCSLF